MKIKMPAGKRQINLENYILKKKARELHKIAPRPPQPTLHPPIVKKVLTLDSCLMLICCQPVCLCACLCFKRNKQIFGSHFSFSVSLFSIHCLFFLLLYLSNTAFIYQGREGLENPGRCLCVHATSGTAWTQNKPHKKLQNVIKFAG